MVKSQDYGTLFNFSPLPKWVYDLRSFEILDVNQAAIKLYGYSREEFLSLNLRDLRPESEIPALIDAHKNIEGREGNIYFGIFTHQKKNGQILRMEINGFKVRFLERDCLLVTCQDVTEKEEQYLKLEESERQLKIASEIANLGYWKQDLVNDILHWSDKIYEIWERKKEEFEVSFESFYSTMHPGDRELFDREQKAALDGTKDLDFPHRIILPNGKIKWVREIGILNRDEFGNPVSFEGTVQDITAEKNEEQPSNFWKV
ncbi:PAS domain-containing protein [Algoriphagus sp.]|uniref:PAS domain-containing protein n=1 Tax=Algoriphagus sp. TaxID=1872435 RepID=UPI00260C68AE|nr:PAS domain-containing protein [Algoriphagus sp.]